MANTTIRNQKLFCLNCGGEFALKFPLGVNEMSSKMKAFDTLHKDCEKTWEEPTVDQSKNIEEKAMWWFYNGEKGMSSEAIWNFFMHKSKNKTNHPFDPADFSRCYKLFQTVPEWKERVLELRALSVQWENLSKNWEKLTGMYEENQKNNWKNYKEIGMYEFMQTLIT